MSQINGDVSDESRVSEMRLVAASRYHVNQATYTSQATCTNSPWDQ